MGAPIETLYLRDRVVTPTAVLEDGVVVDGALIAWVGPAADADAAGWPNVPAAAARPRTVLPGLVDLHDHGGGGASFLDSTTPDEARVAIREHLAHGTTTLVAPELAGVAGDDGVSAALIAAGALPSFGHTDASWEQTVAAVADARACLASTAGRRSARPTVTHLFNGMRPLAHRHPGPIPELLAGAARGDVVVELIADGTHVDLGLVRSVFELVGADSIALVTDAMAATGMPDGVYRLGTQDVTVAAGEARLTHGSAIAGGTAHLVDVLRSTVRAGVPLVDAVRAAATTPATVLGDPQVGALEAARRADVLVTDDDLRVVQVWRAGVVVAP